MPWNIGKDKRCPKSKPWGVTNGDTNRLVACHPSRKRAIQQQRALYVNVPDSTKDLLTPITTDIRVNPLASNGGKTTMDAKTKSVEAEIQSVDSEHPNGEFMLILSKDNLDRDAENLWADEWMHPLPAKIHMDTDHAFSKGMSVPMTAGSGIPEISENGDLLVKGTYAGTPHGQLTRQLVNEGHIWQGSVSYQTHAMDDGRFVRELLNGTFTGVPANPEAVVLASKSNSNGKVTSKGRFADPGYQDDKQPRYPIDTEDHVRAALSYFGQAKNRAKYTPAQQRAILGRIRSRARALGITVADDSKALAWALMKAITTKFTPSMKGPEVILSQTTPAHTVANQDVGAQSVYDDDDDYGEDEDNDDGSWAPGDDLVQAVHDAACALGACCANGDGGSTEMKALVKAWDHVVSNFVTQPVQRGWSFDVTGTGADQRFTLSDGDNVVGEGNLADLLAASDTEAEPAAAEPVPAAKSKAEPIATKGSNADGGDDTDEEDDEEDDDDEEKSDNSKKKTFEVTLADGTTVILDEAMLKEVNPEGVDGPTGTSLDGLVDVDKLVESKSVGTVYVDVVPRADTGDDAETKDAAEDAETKDTGDDADVKSTVTPLDAAKARLRMMELNSKLGEAQAS